MKPQSPNCIKPCSCYCAGPSTTSSRPRICWSCVEGTSKLAETVTGLLEDGEALATGVAQKNAASEHERAVWEKVVVSQKWERSLIAQTCGLLRGFTHPSTLFQGPRRGLLFLECGVDLPEHSVEQFTVEMQGLLAVTMNQRLVEKLSYALTRCPV